MESLPAPEPVGFPEPQPAPARPTRPPRRRGRTILLIAAAAVLGVVGGVAVGYTVQADRAPTPLAALSQPGLAYPAKSLPKGKEADPLSAKEDNRVRTDGDLHKLLLTKPSGARDGAAYGVGDGWLSLSGYALDFESEDYMFEELASADLRRIAVTSWEQDEYRVTNIVLVQFQDGSTMGAVDHGEGQQAYMPDPEEGAGNSGDPIKGSGNGRYYVYKPRPETARYLASYRARAVAQRGNIMIEINILDTKPISKKDIRTLAERQLERL
ncbi:hypothetical protein [Streptomyces sp. AK02-01A]|uniref:hypothetical protein n=1 Tax=Streptomyces sp. AK02-01A TaxID=3028648 RepID=UPI0029A15F8A|nr:hypothetical protein [Streptomyces sp. AK02-01A]MDX3853266.1 hypothetical protein [Streptomyces sp. AK02-01A]